MKMLPVALLFMILAVACARQAPTQPSGLGQSPFAQDDPSGVLRSSVPVTGSARAKASEQVVFSGVASVDSSFPRQSPAGFWIWCEADSSNKYAGECNGAMYFYALGLTKHVEGEIVEPSEGIYEMTVSSTQDSSIVNCRLRNTDEAEHGPNNTVEVQCETPSGSATSTNAVVNVTGPGE